MPTAHDRIGSHRRHRQRPCCSPERCRACRCTTPPACRAPPDRRGSTESNQTPIPRRRTAAASTGSSHHPQKPAACTAGRDPRTRRAPSRRSAPVRPGNRAAGAADAARGDDADGPATAHRRSSNRARSRARPNSRDALPASPLPVSGQSRHTARARSTAPGCEPRRRADGCWVCLGAWKAGSRHRPA